MESEMLSPEAAKALLEELRAICLKLKKCQSLPEADLRGKYRKSYEAAQQEAVRLANRCLDEVCPQGLSICRGCREQAEAALGRLFAGDDYKLRVHTAGSWCKIGDFQNLLDLFRWLRQRLCHISLWYGDIDEGGETLLECEEVCDACKRRFQALPEP